MNAFKEGHASRQAHVKFSSAVSQPAAFHVEQGSTSLSPLSADFIFSALISEAKSILYACCSLVQCRIVRFLNSSQPNYHLIAELEQSGGDYVVEHEYCWNKCRDSASNSLNTKMNAHRVRSACG